MKRFSKKLKAILFSSIALVAVVAIVLCAVLIKKKDNDVGAPPIPEYNKQAQLFLDEQKKFASAVDGLSDNGQKVFGVNANVLGSKTFAYAHGNVIVLREGEVESLYKLDGTSLSQIAYGEQTEDVKKKATITFQGGFALVAETFQNASTGTYDLYSVLSIDENGEASVLASKKLDWNTSVLTRYAGDNYFGIVYGSGVLEIIPYNKSIEPYVNTLGVEVDFYEKSFVSGNDNGEYHLSSIGFVGDATIKFESGIRTAASYQQIIYVGADKYLVRSGTASSYTYKLVRLVDDEIYASAFALSSGYTEVYDTTGEEKLAGFAKIVSICDDEENSEIAYYDNDMNLVAKFYGYYENEMSLAASFVKEEEINADNADETEKIAYTAYYLTSNNELLSVGNSKLANKIQISSSPSYTLVKGYSKEYLAIKTGGSSYFNFIDFQGNVVVDGSLNNLNIAEVLYIHDNYAIINSNDNVCLFNIKTSTITNISKTGETLVQSGSSSLNEYLINYGLYYTRTSTGFNVYNYAGSSIATNVRRLEVQNGSSASDVAGSKNYQNLLLYGEADALNYVITLDDANLPGGDTYSNGYSATYSADIDAQAVNSTKNVRYNNAVIGTISVSDSETTITLNSGWKIDNASIKIVKSSTEYHMTTIVKTEVLGSNISVSSNAIHYKNSVADNADNGIVYSVSVNGDGGLVYTIPLGGESFTLKLSTASQYTTNTYVYFYALPTNSTFSNQINLMSYCITTRSYGVSNKSITLPAGDRCVYGQLTKWYVNTSNLVKKYNAYLDSDVSTSLTKLGNVGQTIDMSAYESNVIYVFAVYEHVDTTTITIDTGNGIYDHQKNHVINNTGSSFVTIYEPIAPLGYHFTGWNITGYEASVAQSYRFKIDGTATYDSVKTNFSKPNSSTLFVSWSSRPDDSYDALEIINLRDTSGNVSITAVYEANVYNIEYANVYDVGADFEGTEPTQATCFVVTKLPIVNRPSWTFDGWIVTGLDTADDHISLLGPDVVVNHQYGFDSNVTTITKLDSFELYRYRTEFYFLNLNYIHGATVTFTAKWTQNVYTINYFTSIQNKHDRANLITDEYYLQYNADYVVDNESLKLLIPQNNEMTYSVPNGYKFVGWYFFKSQDEARGVDLDDETKPTIIVDSSPSNEEPYTEIIDWDYDGNVYAYAYYIPAQVVVRYYYSPYNTVYDLKNAMGDFANNLTYLTLVNHIRSFRNYSNGGLTSTPNYRDIVLDYNTVVQYTTDTDPKSFIYESDDDEAHGVMKGTKLLGFYAKVDDNLPDTWVFTYDETDVNCRGLDEQFRIEVSSKVLTEYVEGNPVVDSNIACYFYPICELTNYKVQ